MAALTAFTPVVTPGALIPEADNNDPAASILWYTCPDGRCGFRQGFRLNSRGQLLQVSGSGYDVANERLTNCELDAFGQTKLNAESNLEGVPLIYPLDYPGGNQSFFTKFVDTSQQRNLLFFSVE